MSLNVQIIDHITIVVRDLDRSQLFYVDFLGMELVPRPNFSFAGLWFQAGKTLVHLIREHDLSGPAGWNINHDLALGRTHHFAFLVENGAEAYEKTIAANVPVCTPPKFRPDGAYQFFILDPDNHVIEICTKPVTRSVSELIIQ